jgi:uncharacterized repeat protein (TIGR03837 family)
MLWDVFCRVIDYHGDAGVCWRLAADLASRGEQVRLWIDDPVALAWMAPQGAAGVTVIRWTAPLPDLEPGDVVIEAFGCDPPASFLTRMGAKAVAPVWLNLEYLSAEDYVERSHGLPSPQLAGPGAGLRKWFYYPGFTPSTGGLLRERAIAPDAAALWGELGVAPHHGERTVSLFSYAHAPFDALLDRLDHAPTLLLVTAGAGQAPLLERVAARRLQRVRVHALPWLTQRDYDRLLANVDLNFARGEDSIVRAMWAGAPFVWHIYRQEDGAHVAKLEALLGRLAVDADVRSLWRAWNGLGPWPLALPAMGRWRLAAMQWRTQLLGQPDLTTQLLQFVAGKRAPG